MDSTENQQQQKQFHFVLVHGVCHGAWCWFKLKPLLESAGHRVTALDMAASGTNTKEIQQVLTFSDYTMPLLDFLAALPPEEKVVAVGHSLGCMNMAIAMDKFPDKISVGVFLTGFMPDTVHPPSYVMEKYNEWTSAEAWLDTRFLPYDNENNIGTSIYMGPKFMSSKLYQLCSVEDRELANMLIRPGSMFIKDLSNWKPLSEQGYGSVKRVYIICEEDIAMVKEFEQWMIKNNLVIETKELKGVDHMPMLCDPKQLSLCLLDVAYKHA